MAQILIVDDEPTVCDIVRLTLERAGHQVYEAPDGEAALLVCNEHQVDLVITDLFMPNMDGLQLIVKLREKSPGARVVAISGSVYEGRPKFLEIAGRMESVLTLTKPFTPDELLAAVEEALN